jgi:hypothetical protein
MMYRGGREEEKKRKKWKGERGERERERERGQYSSFSNKNELCSLSFADRGDRERD